MGGGGQEVSQEDGLDPPNFFNSVFSSKESVKKGSDSIGEWEAEAKK
jgi:hypothetical protein